MNKIYKNSIKYLSLSALILTGLTSCEDDDFEGVDTVSYSPVTVTLTADDNDVTVVETDGTAVYTITASISAPQELDYPVTFEQTAGDATKGVDFDFDDALIIYAGTTSATASVVVYQTGDIENDETFTISAMTQDSNISLTPFTFNGTITGDYINDVLDLVLSWDGSASQDGVTIESFCGMDLDLLLLDQNGILIDYIVGTGDCPEVGSVSGLPDGTYEIAIDLYENPLEDYGFTDTLPVQLTYSQEHFINETVFDYSGGYTLSTPGDVNMGNLMSIATLTVTNGYEYTVTPL
ncbi:hypothetical protein [Bizionia paragorgiae]|uniref:Calx-beta domain-containing protein n=1 Tax=Bizionia paragorgiae TaxID=283786 RepID=A0A1H3ZVE9_BIZPA|nr:hypothetical protein [Bizionia paragorgiae]SEA27244.1 hypothetical protein SAMN04487990_10971 [Bizionia paragorgiae]